MDISDQGDQGDETISLSDVLVARDSCLPEDELWALCRECCLVLEVVNNSPDQFQTLCVTPDTVAFDQVGNVCFLDLDVDPDPIYLPPEYSNNGNPYKAHLFSLGMTLLYAAEYNVDHTTEKISPELHDLLGRMTADSTTLRPDLESTIILCEEQLCGQSSQEVCCGIAAIAGFGLPQDDHYDDAVASGSYATEHDEFSQLESYVHSDQADTTCCDDIPDITEDVSQAESLPWSEEESLIVTGTFPESLDDSTVTNEESNMENRRRRRVSPQTGVGSWVVSEGLSKNGTDESVSKEDMKKRKPAIPKKPEALTNISDSKGTLAETKKGAVTDLVVSELMSESDTDHSRLDSDKNNSNAKVTNDNNLTSKSNSSEKSDAKPKNKTRNGSSSSWKDITVDSNQNISKTAGKLEGKVKEQNESLQKPIAKPAVKDEKKAGENSKSNTDTSATLKNKRNRRKQGLTVADILDSLDRSLSEEELWALCKEGIAAVQRKKKHLPAYLSPDTLLIRESGNVSFKAIPEEKPLELIFMAPELQSKGELSEKTCLYGLSVTLRCAAGKKYSPFSALSVSQDLRELLAFLADSNPAKRPELTDISKICSQHSNGTSSDTVCARLFQDAFKALTEVEEKPVIDTKEVTQQEKPVEQATSTDASKTGLAKPSAFKPTVGSSVGFQPIKPAAIGGNSGGAFCPVPKKLPEVPEPRIPSAFSSPATHFKPIILQQTDKVENEKLGSLKEEDKKPIEKSSEKAKTNTGKGVAPSPKKTSPSDNPNDSDKEVVKKLKELKKNLMKHRQPTMAKEIENEDKTSDSSKSAKSSGSSKRSLPSTQKSSSKSQKSDKQSASKDALESLLKEIQKQGNAPDTQILASAIAQYLKGQMGQTSEGQGQTTSGAKTENPDSSVELDMTVTSGQTQLKEGQVLPSLPSQLHAQLLGQTMSLPLQQYGGNMITGLPQFQFQQDPVTGFLQLTPVVALRPMSVHSNSGSGRSNSNVDFTSPIGTSSVVREGPSPHMSPKSIHNQSDVSNASAISDPSGSKPKGLHGRTAKDLVQKTANLRAKNLGRPSPLQDSMGSKDNGGLHKWKSDHALDRSDLSFYTDDDQTKNKPGSSLSNKLPAGHMYDDTYVGIQRRPHTGFPVPNGQFTNGLNNDRSSDNRLRTHSNSSSPSPSKDSGVSGMNFMGMKPPPSADVSLMDRLLNSNMNVKQQRTLGKIVHLLREEFAFDGYMENGVEDLAMAEYIASLGMLKWETFTSAISEKYCDLYWGTDLLANLYSAVNGNRPASATRLNSRKPPVPKKSSQKSYEDNDSSQSENNENSRERTHNSLQPDITGNRRPHSSFVPRTSQVNDTSDSTDNEHYEKRRKKKSKHELDRMKSSSSNNLLEGTGPFELVPSLNVPENTDVIRNDITNVKPLTRNGETSNKNQVTDTQTLSLPNSNTLIHRQNSADSALNNKSKSLMPNSLSSSYDGRPQSMSNRYITTQSGQFQPKVNGVNGRQVAHGQNRDTIIGLTREVSMSSHSSSQSDVARDSDALPVEKKGHVVYHWAMIQLCMTPEMERFMQDIDEENSQMLLGKLSSLEQQLKMERRLRKKTQKYYRNLVDQSKNPLEIGKTDKTSKAERNQLSQAAKDITEMTQRIRFIDLCKTHIQMLLAELQGIDVSYLYSIAVCPEEEPLQLHPRPDNPLLQFQNLREAQTGCEIQALHAGTPDGLMAYLFASTALSEGFIHQFFFCYRYFTTAAEVLTFLISRYTSATKAGSTETNISRLQHRVIDLLHFWIEGYFSIDFQGRPPLITGLRNFIRDHIKDESESGQTLLALLSNCSTGNNLELSSADPEESEMHFWQKEGTKLKQNEKNEKKSEWQSFKSLVRGKSSAKDKAGRVKISAVVVERRRRSAGSQEILPQVSASRRNDSFMLGDYTSLCLAEQLCLIEQGIFQLSHPVHYLDSKSRGVGVALTMKGMRTPAVTRRSVFEETSSLFVEPVMDSSAIQKMIDHSEEISHWVSAEIVSCSNPKTQVTVLSKFVFIAHTCVELRNFATAMAILDGLENLIVKQLPAWKHLPAKCTSIMDELEASRMFLKNDPLSLMQQGKDCYLYPTIPSAVLFLLHIQQSEIGGFKLANQMFKWGKIRSIAQIIDQIRVFREHMYGFEADHTVQDTLRRRITEMSSQDITTLASQNEMNYQKVSTGSGISGAFKKMRGKLK